MSYEIGSAFIQILPSMDGIVSKIGAAAEEWGQTAGQVFAETFKNVVNAELKDMDAVKIDADTSEASAKAQTLRAEIADLKASINLGVDETDTQEKLATLQAELSVLEAEHPDIRIGVDTGAAEAKLGGLVVEASAADAALAGVGGDGAATTGLDGVAASAAEASAAIPPMTGALVVLGAALLPIGGLALGAFSALPALIAGASTGLGALVLGFSGIPTALIAANAAQNPDATTAQIAAATRALAGLTPAGKSFVEFVTGQLFPVFYGLKEKVQAAFLPLIQTGLSDLLPFFRDLSPIIIQAAAGIGQTFDELAKFMGSKTGLSEIMQIFKLGNGFMSAMGGNFVTIFEAFTGAGAQAGPIVKALSNGITSMVNAFAKWVSGGGFEKFMTWLKDNGPSLVKDLEDVVKAAGKLLVVLTPVGVVIDEVVGYLSVLVSWVAQGWRRFTEFAAVIGAVALVLNEIFDPVAWLVTAVIGIGVALFEVVGHWSEYWGIIKSEASTAWTFLKNDLFDPIANFFTKTIPKTFDDVVTWFKQLPGRIVSGIGDGFKAVWNLLKLGASWLDANIWQPIANFFTGLPVKIGHAAEHMWDGITAAFATVYDAVIGIWNDLHFTLPSIDIFGHHLGGGTVGVPQMPLIPIPKYHDGGVVQGSPGVQQLAYLMPGELVVPAGANLSNIGGATGASPTFNLYGVDYHDVPFVQKVVVDALSQWSDEMQHSRLAA